MHYNCPEYVPEDISGLDLSLCYEFCIMEHLGADLHWIKKTMRATNDVQAQQSRLSVAVEAGKQLLDVLRRIHGLGFLHCDISDNNIMLGRAENQTTFYFIDFGLTKCWKEGARTDQSQTLPKPGRNKKFKYDGTPCFVSQDVVRGHAPGRKDDVISLILVLANFASKSGRLPWTTESVDALPEAEYNSRMLKHEMEDLDDFCEDLALPSRAATQAFKKMLEHLSKLKYPSRPSYKRLQQLLEEAAPSNSKELFCKACETFQCYTMGRTRTAAAVLEQSDKICFPREGRCKRKAGVQQNPAVEHHDKAKFQRIE